MQNMVKYSITACNYNMANTLESSIRSILNQVNSEYEMIVVDGGSTDGSLDILRKLEETYGGLRLIERDPSQDAPLGTDRNLAIGSANGDYVLTNLDMDDVYREGIMSFVEVFHMLEKNIGEGFLLQGDSIKMAEKQLFLNYPFRDYNRGEDMDHWERLYADNRIIWIDHNRFWEAIGYPHGILDKLLNNFESKVSLLRSGKSLQSCVNYHLNDRGVLDPILYYHLVSYILAEATANFRGKYGPTTGFENRGKLRHIKRNNTLTLQEISKRHGFEINREKLSQKSEEIFVSDK